MPRAPSASRADSKVTWLDITVPVRISSAVRSETSVTSKPCRTRPSASAVPAGPAPTTAIRRVEVMAHRMSPADGPPDRRPRGGPRVHDVEVVGAGELPVVDPAEAAGQPAAALH